MKIVDLSFLSVCAERLVYLLIEAQDLVMSCVCRSQFLRFLFDLG